MKTRFPIPLVLLSALVTLAPRPAMQATVSPSTTAPASNALQRVHDPCIIRCGSFLYLFSTGPGIPMHRSKDLIHWERVGRVFEEAVPAWAVKEIPDSKSLWAPDISFFNGRFHLYYSVSRFGSNASLIALASNKTLDPGSPDYAWKDEGKVISSGPGQDYNAIDPNLLLDPPNAPVLSFGSFWSGIKLIALDPNTGKPAPTALPVALAQRPTPPDSIEAPFLIRHNNLYYLFVSFDYCCRGTRSTYNIRVGRATKMTGPYLDRAGKALLAGGGTVVVTTQGDVIGPGHCAVLQEANRDLLLYHYYNGAAQGTPTLQVRPLTWTPDGWPLAGEPLHDGLSL